MTMGEATSSDRIVGKEFKFRIVVPMTLILAIGTGGDRTSSYLRVLEAKRVFNGHDSDSKPQQSVEVASTAQDIDRAKAILNLTVREIAECLGVTRQAVYNWKAGGQIKGHNAAKVQSLIFAADVIAAADLPMSPLLRNRKLPGGRTLLETIASGGSGRDAANTLIGMLREEAEQRRMLSERFSGREKPKSDPSDYGVPSFVEEG
jgi:hypothetical protein